MPKLVMQEDVTTMQLDGQDDLEFELSHKNGAVWLARHLLCHWLGEHQIPADAVDDLALAASEVCTEALTHHPDSLVLRAHRDPDAVVVEIDREVDDVLDEVTVTAGDLSLAAAVSDELVVERHGTHTVVRCRKLVPS